MAQTTVVAITIPFSNTSNGFVASNVQAAIEEAKIASSGFDENKILIDKQCRVLINYKYNVLRRK